MKAVRWLCIGVCLGAVSLWQGEASAQSPQSNTADSPSRRDTSVAQAPDADEAAEERFRKLADRYRLILNRNPRRGTAFDLWYRHYVDAGRLRELVESVEQDAREQPDSAAAQILLGLVYERLGEHERAVQAFAAAEQLAPENYYPWAARGGVLVRLQEWKVAGEALARALALDPPRAEELEIRKQLGRIQLRQGRIDQALKTFEQTVKAFPDDRRVLQELAELLTQELQYDAAIRQWERIIALSRDDLYERSEARIAIAQLHADAGRQETAVELFDQALDDVDPESWLAADIRRRIEDSFRQAGKADGWIVYCQNRLEQHPQELSTMLELGRAWARAGERTKALGQFQSIVKLAPSRKDVREMLIETLVAAGRISEAVEECEELVRQHPQDVEAFRRLGRLHLEAATDGNRLEMEKKAAETFQRIAAIRPDDAALAVQAAEACRNEVRLSQIRIPAGERKAPVDLDELLDRSPLLTAACNNYREAVRRAPDAIENREYLAEFLHALGCDAEAKKVLAEITAPPNDTADRWHRLAELSARFGYLKEAVAAMRESLGRRPDDFTRREFLIELLVRSKDFSKLKAELAALERLAAGDFQERKVLHRRVEAYKAAGWLDREIQALQEAESGEKAAGYWLLGLLLAERWRNSEAVDRMQTAVKLAPKNVELRRDYVRVLEQSGNGEAAVAEYRRLAEIEPQRQVSYFRKIVELELRLGKNEAAQQDVERLLQLSGSSVDGYRLQAEVAFRLGDFEHGLDALRRAVRIAPRDIDIRMQLAHMLNDGRKKTEAREHYWRCFELANGLDEQLMTVAALCAAVDSNPEQKAVVDRLRQLRQQADDPKQLTLCLVEALRILGRPTAARQELAGLSAKTPADLDVLGRLVGLAAAAKDWKAAVGYQEQIVKQDPRTDNLARLAQFHSQNGDAESALRIRKRILVDAGDATAITAVIDQFLRAGHFAQAVDLAEWSLERKPTSWHLQFRSAMGRFLQGDFETAAKIFDSISAAPQITQASASQTAGAGGTAGRNFPAGGVPRTPALRITAFSNSTRWPQQFVTVNRQGQVVSLINANAMSSIPELREIGIAHSAWTHLRMLRQVAGINPVTKRSRASQNGSEAAKITAQLLARALRFPDSPEAARIESVVASYAIAVSTAHQEEWINHRLELAARDPRRLREIVLAHAAVGDFHAIVDLEATLQTHLPSDPLPHLAIFYHTGNPSRIARDLTEGRDLLTKSFDWITEHRPDIRRSLLHDYAFRLVRCGDLEAAQSLVLHEIEAADSLDAAANLDALVLLVPEGPGAVHREFLRKCARLAADAPDSPGTAQQIGSILRFATQDHLKSLTTSADAEALVMLFDRYFELHRPSPRTVSIGPRTASRANRTGTALFGGLVPNQSAIQFTRIGPGFNTFTPPRPAARTVRSPTFRVPGGRGRAMFLLLFPESNADVDDQTLEHLGTVVACLKRWGRGTVLAEHLLKKLSESQSLSDRQRRRLSLATTYAFWLGGETDRALGQLARLCEQFPGDVELKLLLASAYAVDRQTHRALGTLDRIQSTDARDKSRIADLRSRVVALFPWDNGKEMVNVLLTELEGDGEPHLTHYFLDPILVEYRRVTMIGGRPIFGVIAQSVSNATASLASPLPGILSHAAHTKRIAEIERRTSRLAGRFPNHAELAALLALVRFESGDTTGAVEAVRKWQSLVREKAEPFRSPETSLIAVRCLEEPEARPLGYEIAGGLLPIFQSQADGERQQKLLISLCRALVADGRVEEAHAAVRRHYEEMVAALATIERIKKPSLTVIMARAAEAASAFPPVLLPTIVDIIADGTVRDFRRVRNTGSIAFELHGAIDHAREELDNRGRRQILVSLQAMLFPRGPEHAPEFYRWQRRSAAPVGTMGMMVIDLSKELGELDRLRAEWDRHPSADSLEMLVLRMEAAAAAEDFAAAEQRLGELKTRYGERPVRPPVWSFWCMSRLHTDRQAAIWALSLGEGASIQISPGGRIEKITYLPESDFSIREIRLVGHPTLKDADLANVARLKEIRKLVLSYSNITDAGLEHLAGLKSLHTLRLSGTKITDAGLKHLEGLTDLRELLLQGTAVTNAGVERLRRALPDCDIEH